MDKITLAAAVRKFGSRYHIARLLDLAPSSVCRWKAIPDDMQAKLIALPASKLKRGGKR